MDAEAERARADRLAQQCETCLEMQRVCLDLLAQEKAEASRLRGELDLSKRYMDELLAANARITARGMELEAAAAKAERAHPWPPPVNYGPAENGPTVAEQLAKVL